MKSRITARLNAIAGISRVPFLLLPVVLVASGAAAAAYDGTFSWSHTLLALFGLIAAHVAVNAMNEASDMQTGIDLATERTPFTGGSGTLPAGALSVRAAYLYAFVMVAVAVAVGLYFLLEIGAGLGAFAGRVWRIGLMGHASTEANVRHCLAALEAVLRG